MNQYPVRVDQLRPDRRLRAGDADLPVSQPDGGADLVAGQNSVGEFIAFAKANPGKLTFGTPGHGSSPHMAGELFKHLAGVDLTHVPYRGARRR